MCQLLDQGVAGRVSAPYNEIQIPEQRPGGVMGGYSEIDHPAERGGQVPWQQAGLDAEEYSGYRFTVPGGS